MARVTPTNASGSFSPLLLRTGTRFGKECVADRVTRDLFDLPAIQNATGPADLLSQGTGTAALSEINSSEICGLTLDANSESHGVLWRIPSECDITSAVDFDLLWSNSAAAGTGSALFAGTFTELIAGTTAMGVGATAFDTVIASDVDLAANVVDYTPEGQIAAGSLTSTLVPGDDLLALKFAVTLTTITDATVYMGRVKYCRDFVG